MTYRELAKIAGVSLSTVSRALSGSNEVSPQTAEYIKKLALENGIRSSLIPRSRKSMEIAILVPEIISIFYAKPVTKLIDVFESHNIRTSVYICGFSSNRYNRVIDSLMASLSIDGIVSLYEASDIQFPSSITTIILHSYGVSTNLLYYNDLQNGFEQAIEHLTSLGHKRIGYIGEMNNPLKKEMFINVTAEQEIPIIPNDIFISNRRFEKAGYDAVKYYCEQPSLPTALITAYDEIALGAIHSFSEVGIRIPQDISIIGINDIPCAEYASVPLTTIKVYNEDFIELVLRTFLNNIAKPIKHTPLTITWQCKLLIRKSTAPPRTSMEIQSTSKKKKHLKGEQK